MSSKLSRRSLLAGFGALAGSVALAACNATPVVQTQVVEKVVTQVVEKPVEVTKLVEVQQTVQVEVTKVVQQQVEVTKIVQEQVEVTKVVEVTAVPQAAQPITLRLGWWMPGETQWYKVMEAVIGKFEESNPNTHVQIESSSWPDYWQRVQVQIAGGEGPDVQWTSGAYFTKLQKEGAYLDLSNYAKRDNFDYSLYIKQDEFFPEGKIYTMPYSGWGGKLLSYNEAAFDEAGIKYPDKTWTWDTLLEAAQKLTKRDSSGKVTQWGLFIDTGAEYGWLSFMRHNGANWINDARNKTTMDSAEAIEAMQWISDAIHVHKVSPGKSETDALVQAGVTAPFESGQAAMYAQMFTLGLFMEEAPPANIRPNVELFPTIGGKKRWGNGNTNPMTGASYTKFPDDTWKVLAHLAGRESMEMHLAMRSGNPSVYKPLNFDEKVGFLQPIPNLPNVNLRVFLEGLELWTGLDFHDNWFAWVDALQKEVDFMYLGDRDAKETCLAATKAGDQIFTSG